MYGKYLVTGGTGFLGSHVVAELLKRKCSVRVLVMPGDAYEKYLPDGTEKTYGRVDDDTTLDGFFSGDLSDTCVIHCAGIVTIASKRDERLWKVNVIGTKNILDRCMKAKAAKVIYVSSVHAIPENENGTPISEHNEFSPDAVIGQYAKSKASATAYALFMAEKGLPVSIVHPSGIIGLGDRMAGNITSVILSYCRGKLPCGVSGGYDFVDVRDAADGIISCADKGADGGCYILSGHYIGVNGILNILREITGGKKLPFSVSPRIVKLIAPIYEKISVSRGQRLFLTPYSVYTLMSNGHFSHEKASSELSYNPRDIKESLADIVEWLKDNKWLDKKRTNRRIGRKKRKLGTDVS